MPIEDNLLNTFLNNTFLNEPPRPLTEREMKDVASTIEGMTGWKVAGTRTDNEGRLFANIVVPVEDLSTFVMLFQEEPRA